MGLELLEERYQHFIAQHPDKAARLKKLVDQNGLIQLGMRALLNDITAQLCPACAAPCCQCMPVEGWFTEADYFLYRSRYDPPLSMRIAHGLPNGCAFLGTSGCVLPPDCRPFPCVKVNCKSVTELLEQNSAQAAFTKLHEALDDLQQKLWRIIHAESTAIPANGDNPA